MMEKEIRNVIPGHSLNNNKDMTAPIKGAELKKPLALAAPKLRIAKINSIILMP